MSGREFFTNRYEKLGWKYHNVKLKRSIRTNASLSKKTDAVRRLKALEVELEKIPFLQNGYWVKTAKFSVGATSEYLLGLYSVQEAAAQIPAVLFTDVKHKAVLDACAAPGGKTVQMVDLMQNTGVIIALDIKRQRLTALANQLERCHVSNTIAYEMDARQASNLDIKFDRILLDVPCSGNFATDENWFRQRTIEDVERNAQLQRQILKETTTILKEDGEIVYSTCSLEPEEDELNIDWALKNLDLKVENIDCYGEEGLTNIFGKKLDFSVRNCRRIWPGKTQGFFACKLKKRADAS